LVLKILGYLKQLEDGKFLDSSGQSRGKVYFLSNTHFENPDEFLPLAPDISNRTPDISSHLSQFSAEKLEQLYKMAEPVSKHQRVDTAVTKRVIIGLCSIETLSLPILAELLNRSEDSLRKNFLNPMVEKEHTLERAYPQTPNHPKQAYKTV
jgi:hypothetical protein